MEFLNFVTPIFFWGLLALIIPFLLLLTKAKTLKTTSFSSVEFLAEISKRSYNTIEWKKLFLLILRLLILALLVLVFTLPFIIQRSDLLQAKSDKHSIFILDDSYSMGYSEDGQSLFEKAKERIVKQINQDKVKSPLYSLYVFNQNIYSEILKTDEKDQLFYALENISLSDFSSNFERLTQEVSSLVPQQEWAKTEINIVSDFSILDEELHLNFEDEMKSDGLKINLMQVRPSEYQNVFIEDVIFPVKPFLPNIKEDIKVVYRNSGLPLGTRLDFSFWVDETMVASKEIELTRFGRNAVVFNHSFPAQGEFPIHVKVSGDNLSIDNKRFAIAKVQPRLNILLVQDENYVYPFDNPYFYVTKVFQSFKEDNKASWVDMNSIQLENMDKFQLSDYGVVMIADTAELTPKQVTQLKYYVRSGGNVIYSLGDRVRLENTSKNPYLTELLGGYFSSLKEKEKGKEKAFSIQSIDYEHPLFRVFQLGEQGKLNQVSFWKLAPFLQLPDQNNQILLWLDDQWPLLVERTLEKGRVFIWCSTLNQKWNDFPKNPLYVPFLFELFKYVNQPIKGVGSNLKVGDLIHFEGESKDQVFDRILIRSPDGEQITLYNDRQIGSSSFSTNGLGIYEWAGILPDNTKVRRRVAINSDAKESQVRYIQLAASNEEREVLATGTKSLDLKEHRKFVYLPLLYTLLVLFLLEAFVANRLYKTTWV